MNEGVNGRNERKIQQVHMGVGRGGDLF